MHAKYKKSERGMKLSIFWQIFVATHSLTHSLTHAHTFFNQMRKNWLWKKIAHITLQEQALPKNKNKFFFFELLFFSLSKMCQLGQKTKICNNFFRNNAEKTPAP